MNAQGLFTGRSVVVSGGSRGVGLEVARHLVAEGAIVVLNGRDREVVDRAADEVGAIGVAGSAADPQVADLLVATALAAAPLGALVNCAGTAEPVGSSILEIDSATWHGLIDAHLTSTFETSRAAAPHLIESGGAIVTTSSHAFTGAFGGTGYAAGKGAVNSLTYALAAELREHGVRVNAICPGASTRLSTGPEYEETVRELHRRGLLDDLMLAGSLAPPPPAYAAALYVFLASPLAAGITGEVFSAAGGYVGRFASPSESMLTYRDHTVSQPWTPTELAALLA